MKLFERLMFVLVVVLMINSIKTGHYFWALLDLLVAIYWVRQIAKRIKNTQPQKGLV